MPAPSSTADFRELRLERLQRRFGGFVALQGMDLTVRRGEFLALLGPSGCGKSTALNCIAGLLAVSGGRIMLDDRRIDTLRPEERGFGMVFQNYALFPHMTVRDNVAFGLRMRGVGAAERARRAEEALALVRLQQQSAKLPGQLSGGQQQRVALARAIVVEPPLVLMDEPLSNLDAKLRLEMRSEIRRIHNQLGASTIYVTHDQDEALSLADRIVVMRDGAIRQLGTPEQLYTMPAHLDVAEFMGFRNRLDGKVAGSGAGGVTVEVLGRTLPAKAPEPLKAGDPAVVAFRSEDVEVTDGEDGVAATVDFIEYRGREFVGTARTGEDHLLEFRAHRPLARGDAVRLRLSGAIAYPRA